jgi:hypothetical protein
VTARRHRENNYWCWSNELAAEANADFLKLAIEADSEGLSCVDAGFHSIDENVRAIAQADLSIAPMDSDASEPSELIGVTHKSRTMKACASHPILPHDQ